MKPISIILQVMAWLIMLTCGWIAFVELSFFRNGGGWALIGLVEILEYFIPTCFFVCVIPLGVMVFISKQKRDVRGLIISGLSLLVLVVETYLVLRFAPAGCGC
jgi:hypothetical protein